MSTEKNVTIDFSTLTPFMGEAMCYGLWFDKDLSGNIEFDEVADEEVVVEFIPWDDWRDALIARVNEHMKNEFCEPDYTDEIKEAIENRDCITFGFGEQFDSLLTNSR